MDKALKIYKFYFYYAQKINKNPVSSVLRHLYSLHKQFYKVYIRNAHTGFIDMVDEVCPQ